MEETKKQTKKRDKARKAREEQERQEQLEEAERQRKLAGLLNVLDSSLCASRSANKTGKLKEKKGRFSFNRAYIQSLQETGKDTGVSSRKKTPENLQ